ncbi:MAG: hypothetical protein Q8942_15940 [Bacillota bacterium]|nr:hypothetical protein [Bacillota bacterium]
MYKNICQVIIKNNLATQHNFESAIHLDIHWLNPLFFEKELIKSLAY